MNFKYFSFQINYIFKREKKIFVYIIGKNLSLKFNLII